MTKLANTFKITLVGILSTVSFALLYYFIGAETLKLTGNNLYSIGLVALCFFLILGAVISWRTNYRIVDYKKLTATVTSYITSKILKSKKVDNYVIVVRKNDVKGDSKKKVLEIADYLADKMKGSSFDLGTAVKNDYIDYARSTTDDSVTIIALASYSNPRDVMDFVKQIRGKIYMVDHNTISAFLKSYKTNVYEYSFLTGFKLLP